MPPHVALPDDWYPVEGKLERRKNALSTAVPFVTGMILAQMCAVTAKRIIPRGTYVHVHQNKYTTSVLIVRYFTSQSELDVV